LFLSHDQTLHVARISVLEQPLPLNGLLSAGDAPYTTVPVRNETIVKGLESTLQTVYLLHELDEAAAKIQNRQLSAETGEALNDVTTIAS
jgi:hypothetical protein